MSTVPNLSNLAHPVRRTAEIGAIAELPDDDDDSEEDDSKLGRGDTHDWANLSWNELDPLVAQTHEWPPSSVNHVLVGSVGLLVAYLKNMKRMSSFNESANTILCKWEQVHVLLGNATFPFSDGNLYSSDGACTEYGRHKKRATARRFFQAYQRKRFYEESPEGPGLESTWASRDWISKHYKKYKRSRIIPLAMGKLLSNESRNERLEREQGLLYACRKSAEDILNIVISQKRFVLDAIEDYVTIFSELPNDLQSDPEVQMKCGLRGHAPAAIASLRSMLIMTGAEPTRLQSIVRYFVTEFGPSVETLDLTDAQAIDKAVAALAAANLEDATVQELAHDLSAYLHKPGGQLRKRDLQDFVEDDGPYSPAIERRKRRKESQINSLIGYFGYAKVKKMQLFTHAIHFGKETAKSGQARP